MPQPSGGSNPNKVSIDDLLKSMDSLHERIADAIVEPLQRVFAPILGAQGQGAKQPGPAPTAAGAGPGSPGPGVPANAPANQNQAAANPLPGFMNNMMAALMAKGLAGGNAAGIFGNVGGLAQAIPGMAAFGGLIQKGLTAATAAGPAGAVVSVSAGAALKTFDYLYDRDAPRQALSDSMQLAPYNARIAMASASIAVGDIFRNIQTGSSISGSTEVLANAVNSMENSMVEIRAFQQNVSNIVGSVKASYVAGFNQHINETFRDAFEAAKDKDTQVQASATGEALGDITGRVAMLPINILRFTGGMASTAIRTLRPTSLYGEGDAASIIQGAAELVTRPFSSERANRIAESPASKVAATVLKSAEDTMMGSVFGPAGIIFNLFNQLREAHADRMKAEQELRDMQENRNFGLNFSINRIAENSLIGVAPGQPRANRRPQGRGYRVR